MISLDNHAPSDPSSSQHHHHQQNSHDLKVSDIDLKSADAADHLDDTNNPLPNFSIRDYVFGLRSKDITSNWPFSSKSLQLCLKHGVKNLLPPFQSVDCIRNNSSLTGCSLENRLTDEELIISSFDGKSMNDQLKSDIKLVSTNPNGSIGDKESAFHLRGQSGQTRSKEKQIACSRKHENASVNIITKKSRFVVKVNSGVEHITPVSETMASKVCPVCKVFSSSSNTTLNAHIDQCLTGEGAMKWTDHPKVIVKHKVKPRKMRLMVDVYKTAPHCTVEELDRRNGTSWATNSSFPAQEFQFQGVEEEEKEEPRLTKVNPEVADHNEGEVYIDTNGTKVRILSVPTTSSSNIVGGRKLLKGVKGSKLIMHKKKNNIFKKNHHKNNDLKLTHNARKLCSPRTKIVDDPPKSKLQEDAVMIENCSKDEGSKEIAKKVDLGISRPPWACSKRTGLSKKPDVQNRKVELKCHKLKDLIDEMSDKSFPGSDPSSSQSRKKMRTSLSLIKRPLIRTCKFRKEGPPDACPSQHSNDEDDDDDDDEDDDSDDDDDDYDGTPKSVNRSKGSKFSSLSRNLSFPATKFNFKRKFSAFEKSCVKSVNVPSQDSSKEQSRVEKHAGGINRKQETRSITSKSSNEESSVGIQTVNGSESESVRNEMLLSSIRAPSFTGLSTSFDPEFSNQECVELYQDQICSTNRAPNDVDKQENYFQEIDPIPIPGPPGSFLPASPGGEMAVSEEQIHVHEPRVHLTENQHLHDTMDRDSMSNSPVSTVSNSRSSCGKDDMYTKPYSNGDPGFTETGQSQSSFKIDQPACCCSRKEVALNAQDSYTLRKQATESNNFKSDSTASPSKPFLRLMGKNLTVVETDEDEFRRPQSSGQLQPVIFGQYHNNGFESHHLINVHPSRSRVDFRPVHHGFNRYDTGGPYTGPLSRSHYIHNVLDSHTASGTNVYSVASSSRPVKETVIINDEDDENTNTMKNRFLKGNQGQMNPLYTMYPPYVVGGGGGGSSVFHGGSFRPPLDDGDVGGRWNVRPSKAYHPPSYP